MQEKSGRSSQRARLAPFGATLGGALVALVVLSATAPRVAGLLANTAIVAVPSAGMAMALGAPVALLLTKRRVPGAGAACALLGALLLLPLHVTTTAWMAALGDQGGLPSLFAGDGSVGGLLVGRAGAVVLHAVASAPWATLLSIAAWRSVDRRLEEQALLEAGARVVLARVTLVEAAPALLAAGVVVALLAACEIAVTDLLRVRTFAEEVYTQAAAGQLFELASAWRLGLGVAVLGLAGAGAALALVGPTRMDGDTTMAPTIKPAANGWAAAASWIGVALLVAVPVASLVYRAGLEVEPTADGPVQRWSVEKVAGAVALAPWQHRRELGVSLTLAASVATASVVVGAPIAWLMRASRRRGAVGCAVLAMLMAVPGPVVGVAVIRLLNQPLDSPVAWLGSLYGTWFAPWLAQMARITPPVALLLWPAASRVPADVLDAARSDGASRLARFSRVAVPAIAPAVGAAWLVAFALSLGELSSTVLTAPPGTPPLSVRLLSLLHYGVEDRVAAICLVLVAGYGAVAFALTRLLPPRTWLG